MEPHLTEMLIVLTNVLVVIATTALVVATARSLSVEEHRHEGDPIDDDNAAAPLPVQDTLLPATPFTDPALDTETPLDM